MEALKEAIRRYGRHLGNGIIKVDAFLNHQIDPALIAACGQELARRFRHLEPTKVLTAEISGIGPALMTAYALGVPLVFARKHKPLTMGDDIFFATAPSHTKGGDVTLLVAADYLRPGDRVLIVDDFLATGATILALARLAQAAGARVIGIGAVIEKRFEGGRDRLRPLNVPIESLAVVTGVEGDRILLEGDEATDRPG
ncbi:xanthine phosphoribosyltransferase [Thermoflexus sp.]|uniref:xanthine phosphoribosyltransferase n=1 Tax=Thermoflexus sp. TaxID=1969742 RepID=UPI0026206240|nr:xanthine phosphoribosyltransferase [Thermoflexus sp.]